MNSRHLRNSVLVLCAAGAVFAIGDQLAVQHGEASFARLGCASCHANGSGPNLARVRDKYDGATMVRFIEDPAQVYRERGHKPLNPGYVAMHKVKASKFEIHCIALYLRNVSE